jgi:hypothetical protein
MEKVVFHSKFVQRVMICVSSVRYSIRFNGTALSPFRSSHDLRHGDSLSPYLFHLVADCLSVLMKHYERQGLISGIRVSRSALVFHTCCWRMTAFYSSSSMKVRLHKYVLCCQCLREVLVRSQARLSAPC